MNSLQSLPRSSSTRFLFGRKPSSDSLPSASRKLSSSKLRKHEENYISICDRRDVNIGKVLGKGHFSKVYEVTGFNFVPRRSLTRSFSLSASLPSQDDVQLYDNGNFVAKSSLHLKLSTTPNSLTSTNKKFAIKVLKNSILRQGGKSALAAANDLAEEANILSSLHHINIINIYGKYIFDGADYNYGDAFLIIDRLHETLHQKILKWKCQTSDMNKPNDDVIRLKTNIAFQVARALAYIHDCGLIFRDLKPQNIGFIQHTDIRNPANDANENQNPMVKLFDFGLCRRMPNNGGKKDGCFRMSIAGTPRYMAPEILNRGRYNKKADVYSWSMVFYEMLSLIKPYQGYNIDQLRLFVCNHGERPELTGLHLPEELKKAIIGAWAQDLSKRKTIKEICKRLVIFMTVRSTESNIF